CQEAGVRDGPGPDTERVLDGHAATGCDPHPLDGTAGRRRGLEDQGSDVGRAEKVRTVRVHSGVAAELPRGRSWRSPGARFPAYDEEPADHRRGEQPAPARDP